MTVLQVGAGKAYATISSAVAASSDGDDIQVQAGTYTNDFAEIGTRITIEGVGGMAKLVASGPIPNGKAILITDTDVTIKNLEFSGATVNDGNGAGIRYQSGNLTILNSYFHDNQDGLLAGANPSGSITIRNSEFSHNGVGDGYTHNLYVGDVGALTIDASYFHDAVVGHEIKSRAESTTITNTRVSDGPNGSASYSIDLPNGGNAVISNDVIEQGPNSQNPNIIAFGEEGNLHGNSALQVTNTTILNNLNSGSVSAIWNPAGAPVTVTNVSTYGLTSGQILRGSGAVSSITALSSEPALNSASPVQASGSSTSDPGTTTGGGSTGTGSTDTGSTGTGSTGTGSTGTGSTGTASGTPPPPADTSGLVLDISEDAWQGDAQYTISVDGQQVGGVRTATASHSGGGTEAIPLGVTLAQGSHSVGVTFLNDAFGGTTSTDRNLYVDGATLNGQAVAGSAATLYSAGVSNFGVQVAGSAQSGGSDTPPAASGTGSSGTGSSGTSSSGTDSSGTGSDAGTTTPPPTANGLVLDISEDAWQGDAQYTISVDGQQIGGVHTASASHSAGRTEAVPISVSSLAQGSHTVGVTFLNDAYGGTASTDRNLYIDGATLDGQAVQGSAATLLAATTSTFGIQVAASAAPPQPVTSTLTLHVAEDAWQGDAQMAVSVDGSAATTYAVTASHADGSDQTMTIGGLAESFSSHDIAVSFLNDAWGGTTTTDRNLYLNSMQLDGRSVPGGSATFLWNSSQHFFASAPDGWQGTIGT